MNIGVAFRHNLRGSLSCKVVHFLIDKFCYLIAQPVVDSNSASGFVLLSLSIVSFWMGRIYTRVLFRQVYSAMS